MAQGIGFRCWTCAKTHDVRVLVTSSGEPLDECCFKTLTELAELFGRATFIGVLKQLPQQAEKQAKFNDAIADAAILSPNLEVRAAAIKWRNERASKLS